MKFEDALTALRNGAKIRHPVFAENEYLMGCYLGLPNHYDDEGNLVIETPDDRKARGMSIVKMDGDRQADVMAGKLNHVAKIKRQLKAILTQEEYKKYHTIWTEIEISKVFDNDIFLYPQLNLFLVMSDDWEILESSHA